MKPKADFNEQAYCQELIRNGLSETAAKEVAASTARLHSEISSREAAGGEQPKRRKAPSQRANAYAKPPQGELLPTAETPAADARARVRPIVYDYKGIIPNHVRELIEAHLAIESEEAAQAGKLGFMTRSLTIATLPHRRHDDWRFIRKNGDFTLTMMTAHPEGLPFGILPRLLLAWVCTEVTQKRERVLHLGDNLSAYLTELGLSRNGGKRGDITRLKFAMTTLFSSVISAHYVGKDKENWMLQNVMLADGVEWWTPQGEHEAGQWRSRVQLSEHFYSECLEHNFPYDMRALAVLGKSSLAIDIYLWLTYRMSYCRHRTQLRWEFLASQFGSNYAKNEQGLRDFKRAFLREMKHVLIVYPNARVSESASGDHLVLDPSPTHIRSLPSVRQTTPQSSLPFAR